MIKKLGCNAILNVLKSIMAIIFPIVTFPYVSRILSVENIGKVNYASSVVSYFALFSMLGIQVYATREGAKIRDNKEETECFVSEVFTINVIAACISILVLGVLILSSAVFENYRVLLCIYALQIPLTVIGSDWINSIFEDYLYITLRTIVFQLLGLGLIFALVKNNLDYNKYALCQVVTSYGAGILNALYTRKYCKKHLTLNRHIFVHLKPILILFATNLASLIYSSADTTMLGVMASDYNVGIYTTAVKVYTLFKQLVFAVVVVCLPRFSYFVSHKTKEEYTKVSNILFNGILVIAIPLAVGIFSLSSAIVEILAGNEFADAVWPLRILSFAILFAIIAYFNMQLVLLPNKKDSTILRATAFSGIFNIVANYFLIPYYFENAAAFTTLISEMIVCAITYVASNKVVKLRVNAGTITSITIATCAMAAVLKIINSIALSAAQTLFFGFLTGILFYFAALVIMKNRVVIEISKFIRKSINKNIKK